ncbi:MAG: HupE/UreJ family protein [Cyclobacteriaceae bacterium]
MTPFELYLETGFHHILDIRGYDHILFVVVLCAAFEPDAWKKIIGLVTSFTIGHSITLILASKELISVNSDLTELLIAVTILMAAIGNFFRKPTYFLHEKTFSVNFLFAGGAGLIHGLGFSGFLKALLGAEESIVTPLFAFNIGLEFGQIIIVFVYMLISFITISIFGVSQHKWRFFLSAAVAGIALTLILDRL